MAQLLLWDDVRLPLAYSRYYREHGRCVNCQGLLNHDLHALNHWRRYHTVKQSRTVRRKRLTPIVTARYRYYAWHATFRKFKVVDQELYGACKRDGICTARERLGTVMLRSKAA